jgi:hypothetical protein
VPIELVYGLPILSARLNGRGPFNFILDTGAAGSVIGEKLAGEVRLPALGQANMGRPGSDQPLPATVTRIEKIEIGGLTIDGASAVYADLSAVLKKVPNVQGVLSTALMPGILVSFNYPAKEIEFRRGELPPADGQTIFEWSAKEKVSKLPVEVGSENIRMQLDTGSTSGFSVTAALSRKLTWMEEPVEGDKNRTVDLESRAFTGRVKGSVRVGKFLFDNPLVQYSGDGLNTIGYDVLKNFVVTIDAKNRRLELKGN